MPNLPPHHNLLERWDLYKTALPKCQTGTEKQDLIFKQWCAVTFLVRHATVYLHAQWILQVVWLCMYSVFEVTLCRGHHFVLQNDSLHAAWPCMYGTCKVTLYRGCYFVQRPNGIISRAQLVLGHAMHALHTPMAQHCLWVNRRMRICIVVSHTSFKTSCYETEYLCHWKHHFFPMYKQEDQNFKNYPYLSLHLIISWCYWWGWLCCHLELCCPTCSVSPMQLKW